MLEDELYEQGFNSGYIRALQKISHKLAMKKEPILRGILVGKLSSEEDLAILNTINEIEKIVEKEKESLEDEESWLDE